MNSKQSLNQNAFKAFAVILILFACQATASPVEITLDYSNSTCSEIWSCGGWSSCSGGVQARTCVDTNGCGTVYGKPAELQSCGGSTGGGGTIAPIGSNHTNYNVSNNGTQCQTNWTCANLSECIGGYQSAICIDANNCAQSFNDTRECNMTESSSNTVNATSSNSTEGNNLGMSASDYTWAAAVLLAAAILAIIFFKIFRKPKGNVSEYYQQPVSIKHD